MHVHHLSVLALLVTTACSGAAREGSQSASSDTSAAPSLFANPAGATCRYPIVLEHGFAASNEPSSPWAFVGAADDLMAQGHALVVADEVQPFGDVATRAATMADTLRQVAAQCAQTPGCDPTGVHVIAHSYGGLHAREYLEEHPPGNAAADALPPVVSLTTIATPNYGTAVADLGLSVVQAGGGLTQDVANLFAQLFGGTFTSDELASNPDVAAALGDLSEANAASFAASHPAVPGVSYFAWAAVSQDPDPLGHPLHPENVAAAFPNECDGQVFAYTDTDGTTHGFATQLALLPAHDVTGHHGQDVNDGMATVASAKALPGSTFMGCVPADHLAEVGHSTTGRIDWTGFDALPFLRYIAAGLANLEPPAP